MAERQPVTAATAGFSNLAFDALLESYLHTSLRASLTEVRQELALIPEEMRLRAWHLLSYALRTGKAWPETRDLLTTLAPKMEQAGFREEWIAYLASGVEVGTQHNDRAATAEFALQIATLWRMLSEYDRAVQWLDSSLAGFRQEQDRRGEARTLNERAWIEQLRRRYDDASQHVEQALALLDEDDPERGMCYRTQGMIAIYRGEWEQAEAHHRAALASFERNGDTRKAAWSLVNLSIVLCSQQRFASAITYLTEAIATLNQLGDIQHCLTAQMNLGLTLFHNCEIERAIQCYLNAELIAQQLHDRHRLADNFTNLGLAYLAHGDSNKSIQSFHSSIDLYRELGIVNMVVNAMDGLAMSYISCRRFDIAIAVLEDAMSMLPKLVDVPNYHYYEHSLNEHRRQAIAEKDITYLPTADIV